VGDLSFELYVTKIGKICSRGPNSVSFFLGKRTCSNNLVDSKLEQEIPSWRRHVTKVGLMSFIFLHIFASYCSYTSSTLLRYSQELGGYKLKFWI